MCTRRACQYFHETTTSNLDLTSTNSLISCTQRPTKVMMQSQLPQLPWRRVPHRWMARSTTWILLSMIWKEIQQNKSNHHSKLTTFCIRLCNTINSRRKVWWCIDLLLGRQVIANTKSFNTIQPKKTAKILKNVSRKAINRTINRRARRSRST